MKTVYQANDGTIFDNQFDCTDYESDKIFLPYKKVVMLDLDLKEINLRSKAFFIIVPNDKGILEYVGVDEPGKYYFDCHLESWIKLDDKKKHLVEFMQRLDDADIVLDKILESRNKDNLG